MSRSRSPRRIRIIVDEAHGFRNPRTRRYRALAQLCREAEVVLLTATPINNSLWDLYFQMRLFAGDGTFATFGVGDLAAAFRTAALTPDGAPPPALGAVLREVVIRRPRRWVDGPASMEAALGLHFPRRAPPHPIRYDLDGAYAVGLAAMLTGIESLTLAAFRLESYGGRSQPGVPELVRLMLLKRLESGGAALGATIRRLEARTEAAVSAIERGLLPSLRGVAGSEEQLFLAPLVLAPAPPDLDRSRFLSDTANDLAVLRSLASNLPAGADPKVLALEALLFRALPDEKVLVFTEFRETAIALWRRFAGRGGVGMIHGDAAYLGAERAGRREVVTRFAPASNGARPPPPHEAVRILIATDVLSEGLNLQDAAHVVSYDLPWNPVRLMQRVGRIDRLGSRHPVIHIHHFLPGPGLEVVLRLVERLRRKLAAIRSALVSSAATPTGLVSAAATPTFEPGADVGQPDTRGLVQRLVDEDPLVLDELETADPPEAMLERDLRRAVRDSVVTPTSREQLSPVPSLAAIPAPTPAGDPASPSLDPDQEPPPTPPHTRLSWAPSEPTVILALRRAGSTELLRVSAAGEIFVRDGLALATLHAHLCGADRSGSAATPESHPVTETDLELASRAVVHAMRWLRQAAAVRLGAGSRAAAVAAWIRRAAAAGPGGPDDSLCARIDRLVASLALRGRAGDEAMFGILLTRWRLEGASDANVLCMDVERLLGEPGGETDSPSHSVNTEREGVQPVPVVIAAMVLRGSRCRDAV